MRLDPERLACLDALGIDVYVRRRASAGDWSSSGTHAAAVQSLPATQGPDAVAATPDESVSELEWEPLQAAVAACTRCELHRTRTQTVFGRGDRKARWMIVGEAPGAEEDRQGQPFVGRAGQLLDTMVRALGLGRDDVYVANILKCRPPGNRDPKPDEAAHCRGYLDRQIALVAPTLILAVGRIAAQNLLGTDSALGKLRGRVHTLGAEGWPVIVTYHPAYLLRSPGEKRKAWQDLVFAREVFRQRELAGRTS
jgi:uracil-DNA glycosylase family 4